VDCCSDLERIEFGDRVDGMAFDRSDILAVISLLRLKYLDIGACHLADEMQRIEGASNSLFRLIC
jgi:hypothetical protein